MTTAKKQQSEVAPITSAVVVPALSDFALVTIPEAEMREVIDANLKGSNLSVTDLDRIKVPSGGGTIWQLPSGDGAKEFEGVVVFFRDSRGYWRKGIDEGGSGAPPDCYSDDSCTGYGDPGGDCLLCPLAQFGSAKSKDGTPSRGQACQQKRQLFIVDKDSILPIVVQAPATSLKGMRQYFVRLAGKALPYYSVITKFALREATNKSGIKYAEIVPSQGAKLQPEERARMKTYAESMVPVFESVARKMSQEPAEEEAAD